jgi:hypothetical protein
MIHEGWQTVAISSLAVDWTRILSVLIDEPYYDDNDLNPACNPWGSRNETVKAKLASLQDIAEEIHELSRQTRVWMNFHWREVSWMRDELCPAVLNDPSFDVISLDKYEVDFKDIESDYDWFIEEFPEQQVALIPAASYDEPGDGERAGARMLDYFRYANTLNRQCTMGLGRMGGTGSYDGCRVWIVAGWSAEPHFPLHGEWWGMLRENDPDSDAILTVWKSEFSKIRRSGKRALSEPALSVVK